MLVNYERLAYIDTGLGPQARLLEEAKHRAETLNLRFEQFKGDRSWIDALVNGPWDKERFLVVPPGHHIIPRYDSSVIDCEAN